MKISGINPLGLFSLNQFKRRKAKCLEETEQAQEARDQGKAEEWVEASQARAEAYKARVAVLRPDPEVIVFALIAVKRPPIILGSHVMNSSARTAGIPWQGSKRSHNN